MIDHQFYIVRGGYGDTAVIDIILRVCLCSADKHDILFLRINARNRVVLDSTISRIIVAADLQRASAQLDWTGEGLAIRGCKSRLVYLFIQQTLIHADLVVAELVGEQRLKLRFNHDRAVRTGELYAGDGLLAVVDLAELVDIDPMSVLHNTALAFIAVHLQTPAAHCTVVVVRGQS